MAEILHITPKQLSFLSDKQQHLFLLFHFAINEKYGNEYIEFYVKDKRYKILDNSFYELRKAINYDDYFNIAEMLDVDEIVLPDKLWDGEWTRQNVQLTLDEYYDYIKSRKWKVAAVVQGKNLRDITKTLEQYMKDERIDVIMIPRKIVHKNNWSELNVNSYSRARIMLMKMLEDVLNKTNKPIHFLGANSLWEIVYVYHTPYIRSIDTKFFSKFLLKRKWEEWDENLNVNLTKLKEEWRVIKDLLNFYGEV